MGGVGSIVGERRSLGRSRIAHDAIQFTTDTSALLSYLVASLLMERDYKSNDFERLEQSIIVLIVNNYMTVRRQ